MNLIACETCEYCRVDEIEIEDGFNRTDNRSYAVHYCNNDENLVRGCRPLVDPGALRECKCYRKQN